MYVAEMQYLHTRMMHLTACIVKTQPYSATDWTSQKYCKVEFLQKYSRFPAFSPIFRPKMPFLTEKKSK